MGAGVVGAIIVLIAALFSVDNYYAVLLSGAVERALDLEFELRPPVRLTKYLSTNAISTNAVRVTFGLYVALLVGAAILGVLMLWGAAQTSILELIAARSAFDAATLASNDFRATAAARLAVASAQVSVVPTAALVVGIMLSLFAAATVAWIVWYQRLCNRQTCMDGIKKRDWPEGVNRLPDRGCSKVESSVQS